MADEFGLTPENDLPDFVQETPSAPAPESTPAPETAPEPAPAPEQPSAEELYPGRDERPRGPDGRFLPKQEVQEETQEQEEERVALAGKYQDVPALEKGYRELRDLQRRTAERAKAYEQRVQEVEFRAKQMQDAVERARTYVQQVEEQQRQFALQQQQQPQYEYDEFGNLIPVAQPPVIQPPQGLSPEQVEDLVQSRINQQMAAQAQAMQEQQDRAENYNMARTAQQEFFERHPEVQKDGTVDEDIANTILALNESWSAIDGSVVDIRNGDILEIAYEAAKNPSLRAVLERNPQYIDDDEGMALARRLAGLGVENPGTQPVGRMTAQPNTPVAERGSSPAQRGATPLDEFDQAAAEYRAVNKARGSDVFFGE